MPENPVRVIARFSAKPESVEDLTSLLTGFIEPTRAEPGCVTYELLQNADDPTDLTFVEEWTSKKLLDRHLESPHIAQGRKELPALITTEPDIRVYTLLR